MTGLWAGAGKPSSRAVTFMGDDGAEPYIDKLVNGGWREGETTTNGQGYFANMLNQYQD